jgi:hypothetical protein
MVGGPLHGMRIREQASSASGNRDIGGSNLVDFANFTLLIIYYRKFLGVSPQLFWIFFEIVAWSG